MFPNDDQLMALFSFETGDRPIDDDPPFHILILGDWSGTTKPVSLTERRPIMIDRDNFDEVVAQLKVNLNLDFGNGAQDSISINFNELEDFHPDQLYRQLPIFAHLRDLRRRLNQPNSFHEAAGEVRAWFDTPVSSETVADGSSSAPLSHSDDLLDSILSNQAVKPAVARKQSDLDSLISKIVAPFIVQVDEAEQSQLITAVDQAIAEIMRRILHHPNFQELESAWRGLYFLVRRIETDTDLKIFIADVTHQELLDNLKSVSGLFESIAYRILIRDTIETPGGQPWAVIGGNYGFSLDVENIAALIRLAQFASAASAPFVSYVRPELFSLQSFAENQPADDLRFSEDNRAFKLWSTLREIPESKYLGLSPMRFLTLLPYGNSTDSIESFNFEEHESELTLQQMNWTNPCFAVLYLLASNYRRGGWSMNSPFELDITGLPFCYYPVEGQKLAVPCAETLLTEKNLRLILDQGLLPLVSYRDSDRIRLPRLQSVASSGETIAGRWKA